MPIGPDDVTLRHELRPGDLGMVTHLHGIIYAREHGLYTTFEPYVARPLSDFFLAGPDAGRLWIAEAAGRTIGSIAMLRMDEPGVAQLRWFILTPEARGIGLGRRLIETAFDYCRAQGIPRVCLWTFSDLDAAIALYRKAGFRLSEERSHEIWGAVRCEQRWDLELDGPA